MSTPCLKRATASFLLLPPSVSGILRLFLTMMRIGASLRIEVSMSIAVSLNASSPMKAVTSLSGCAFLAPIAAPIDQPIALGTPKPRNERGVGAM